MKTKSIILLTLCATLGSGCATMKDSLLTGFASGAALGAGAGVAVNQKDRSKSAAIGALTGGVLGMVISHFTHKSLEKRDAKVRRETLFNLDKHDVSTPSNFDLRGDHGVSMPVVDSELVEEHVSGDGKKLIEQHRVWTIREDSQWVPKSKSKNDRK